MNINVNCDALEQTANSLIEIEEDMRADVQVDDEAAEKYVSNWESEAADPFKELQNYISEDVDVESTRVQYCAEELMNVIEERMEIDDSSTLDV